MKVEVCKIDEDNITIKPVFFVRKSKGPMVKIPTTSWLMINLDCVAECFNRGNLHNRLAAMKVGGKKCFDWELKESEVGE